MAETQTGKMINRDISNPEHRRINKLKDKIITEMRQSSKEAAEALANAGLDHLSYHKKRIRPCANCGRAMTIVGHGLCWTCYQVYRQNKDDLDLPELMAAVKERVHSPAFKALSNSRKGRKAKETIQPTAPAEAGIKSVPPQNVKELGILKPYKIEIEINSSDVEMIFKFTDICRRDRRTIEAQILMLIEQTVLLEQRKTSVPYHGPYAGEIENHDKN